MEALRTEAFNLLKPYCVQLTKEHTRSNISRLFGALQSINVVFLQDLQEYVVFPLRVILKHPKKHGQDLYWDLFTCMEYVLGHTKITRWDFFQDIFNTATTMLSCPTDQSKVAKLSEELKIAIIQTLRTLVKNAEYSVLQHLYTVIFLPLLGHAVSLLLNIAEGEKARNVKILAMECLLDLSQADSKYSQCVKADIGGIYASFLPGISVTLCKIITGDTKQGYAVISKAIYVWMRVVNLVLDDKLLEIYRQKLSKQEQSSSTKDCDPRLQGLIVSRDTKWVDDTSGNLYILVKQVSTVRSHTSWRVRLGLVECAEHLLMHCASSMKECVPVFLEILVSLIGDDYTKVANGSRHALDLFSQSQASDQQRQLIEIVETNLHNLTTTLPRQIQTATDENKMVLLNLLSGYLSLLGSRVKSVLLSLPHLKRLSMCLVQTLELEYNDVKIVEERTTITGHGSSAIKGDKHAITRPIKYFKHFTNEQIFHKVQYICRLLGYYGDINLLVDHFLDIFHESSMFKMQATLVINEMMIGTTGEYVDLVSTKNGKKWHQHSRDELDIIVRMLVDEYLNPVNFDLVTSTKFSREEDKSLEERLQSLTATAESESTRITIAKINRNIVQTSLFVEGLGNFAKIMKTDFVPLLMRVLYPLLEKLGDDSAYISSSAFVSLLDICEGCGYKCIDSLIRGNTDYLMNSISQKLRHFTLNKRCPLVLKVMLQYSSADLLPLIEDTIQEILDSLDDNYEEDAVLFMGVLNELTKAVVRWFPSELDEAESTDQPSSEQDLLKQASGEQKLLIQASSDIEALHQPSSETESVTQASSESDSTEQAPSETESILQATSDKECANQASNETEFTNQSFDETAHEHVLSSTEESKCHTNSLKASGDTDLMNKAFEDNKLVNVVETCDNFAVEESNTALKSEPVKELLGMVADLNLSPAEELSKFFTEFLELQRLADGNIADEDIDSISLENNNETEAPSPDPEEKPPAPKHVTAVKEVMMRCKHIVSSRNPRLRLLVLDTISQSCTALKQYQDELLPLIHQVWSSFSLCFTDEEKLITIKALDVLQVIVECSGDFVKQRIIKDVIPKLTSFLKNQSEISVCAGQAYQFTVNYKLQLAILKNIAKIARRSNVDGENLDQITSSCVLYLNCKQPSTLQHVCMECCRSLISLNADQMWLKLCSLYCPRTFTPPDNRFKHVKGLAGTSQNNVYTANVTKLMKETRLLGPEIV